MDEIQREKKRLLNEIRKIDNKLIGIATKSKDPILRDKIRRLIDIDNDIREINKRLGPTGEEVDIDIRFKLPGIATPIPLNHPCQKYAFYFQEFKREFPNGRAALWELIALFMETKKRLDIAEEMWLDALRKKSSLEYRLEIELERRKGSVDVGEEEDVSG